MPVIVNFIYSYYKTSKFFETIQKWRFCFVHTNATSSVLSLEKCLFLESAEGKSLKEQNNR